MSENKEKLGQIVNELENEIERENLKIKGSNSKRALIWIVASLLLISLLFFANFFSARPKKYKTVAEYAVGLREDYPQKAFTWTYADFNKLRWKTDGASDTKIEDVVRQYGAPTEVTQSTLGGERVSLTLDYRSAVREKAQVRKVSLIFGEFDGKFTLVSKSFTNLPGVSYEDEIGTSSYDWTTASLASLEVGDQNGEGGVDIEDVIKDFGPPSKLFSFGYNDDYRTLGLQYLNGKGDNVTLYFQQRKSGEFGLKQKSGTIVD